jgi:hypothetical protein
MEKEYPSKLVNVYKYEGIVNLCIFIKMLSEYEQHNKLSFFDEGILNALSFKDESYIACSYDDDKGHIDYSLYFRKQENVFMLEAHNKKTDVKLNYCFIIRERKEQ